MTVSKKKFLNQLKNQLRFRNWITRPWVNSWKWSKGRKKDPLSTNWKNKFKRPFESHRTKLTWRWIPSKAQFQGTTGNYWIETIDKKYLMNSLQSIKFKQNISRKKISYRFSKVDKSDGISVSDTCTEASYTN